MPTSAVDCISPAFEHTKQQLFRPFRFGQWTRLALVGLCAGELSSGGGCSNNFNFPTTNVPQHRAYLALPNYDSALIVPLVIVFLIAIPLLWLLFLYISSHMRFVLFDSVIAKTCSIQLMWRARTRPAMQYFVWQIVFSLITLGGIVVIVGIPVLFAFLLGWLTAPREHLPGLILGGLLVFFIFAGAMLLALFVHVFTKDFVVPVMALEGVSAFDGWTKLLAMLKTEKGRYAGYAGMKIVLALGAAIIIGIAVVVVILLLLIPVGGLGVVSVLLGQAVGLTWNVFTITLAVVVGCIALMGILYLVSLISVPVIVFFPAYSIYFFAARYPMLANLIYPAPPPPIQPVAPSPQPVG